LEAKQSFENGNFNPFIESDRTSLEKISGGDIFISERLALTLTNEKPVLTIEFVDGLPIPPRDWSYDGILEFKNRHQLEYKQFWDAVFNLAMTGEWIEKPNLEMSIRKDILEGLEAYNRYSAETFGLRLKNSLSLNITPARTSAFLTMMFGPNALPLANLALPITYNFTVAGLGLIRLALDMKRSTPELSQTARGMSYLSKIQSAN
jgi:hypothetical protein